VSAGDIYKGTHSGWYSVSDECFYSPTQTTKGEDGRVYATETGNEVVWEEEENWKFRLGAFRERLTTWASREGGELVCGTAEVSKLLLMLISQPSSL
jgi:methionyl-tRNA synthetase